MNIFYLVRHAHADWTPNKNRPLSTHGHRDAERVAEVLHQFPITVIYSSPARRARQTVAPLAVRLDLPIHTLPELRERQLCDGAVEDFFAVVEATWVDPSFAHPGGESNAAAQQRGIAAICRLQEQHPIGHLVLATHGNLLALLLQHFDPSIDYAFWKSLTMPDIYRLKLNANGKAAIQRLWQ
jgi:2,3-bisphosphoglycerate-dependent phosphoglycerate mutase